MTLFITYLSNHITQIMEVVEQKNYLEYSTLSQLMNDEKDFKRLPIDEQEKCIQQMKEIGWIGKLYKEGKLCTDESPIYKAFLEGAGLLRLPPQQWGDHPVIVTVADMFDHLADTAIFKPAKSNDGNDDF